MAPRVELPGRQGRRRQQQPTKRNQKKTEDLSHRFHHFECHCLFLIESNARNEHVHRQCTY